MTENQVYGGRPERPEEVFLREWFAEQEKKSIDNLEGGARQIISLVSLFYGAIFGVLSLGQDKLEPSLHSCPVLVLGTVAVLAFLIAVIAALNGVLPFYRFTYNPHKPAEQKETFQKILNRKWWSVKAATIAFGVGLIAFAVLVLVMLYYR